VEFFILNSGKEEAADYLGGWRAEPLMASNDYQEDPTRSFTALTAGTRVAQYEVIEKIGSGGMGEVYLAEDTILNRKVALKFLPSHLCRDKECRKRFSREAQVAAALDHPNIAAIYEVGEFQDRPFYSMQVVEGQSLKDVIAGKDLPVERILEIVIQVCEGLQAAHDKGIIHRDIKPSNILLDDHGRVRIVDFGLASIRGSEQLTKTGSTLGTVGYMSPEQVQGNEVDQRSDLFSLGVVLYELITKRNPFKRDTEAATLKAVSGDLPEPLARFKSGLPDGLQAIISKALEKELQTRYQHADSMLSDLIRVKRTKGVDSSVASGPSLPNRPSRIWWSAAALVAAATVVILVTKPWKVNTPPEQSEKIMLAVLPFENLGDPEDSYFADGMTEEIIARLATVHDLGVIARTSVILYKQTDKPIQQIGQELGVEYILEGTIRWQDAGTPNARIRITPRLIRVSDATHVWADVYDEVVSEVFQLQTKISGLVVDALNISLVDTERQALAAIPTTSLEAYDYFLQGKEYYDRYKSMDDLRVATSMFEKAIAIDSTFAIAHAWLTQLYLTVPSFVDPQLADSLKQISYQHALKADKFSSSGFEGHLAMGRYYFGIKQYDRALNAFNKALAIQPNNTEAIDATAGVLRRQGRWGEALSRYEKNALLNPRSVGATWELAMTYYYMRRFTEGDAVVDKGISFSPDWWPYRTVKAWAAIEQGNSIDTIIARLESVSSSVDKEFIESFKMEHLFLERDFEKCVALPTTADNMWHGDSVRYYLVRGKAYDELGRFQKAHAYYDSARTILETRIDHGSTTAEDYTTLGRVYALIGDTALALQMGEQGHNMLPLSKDAIDGALVAEDFAKILVLTGHPEYAIDILDTLLSVPSHLNLINIRQDVAWDPIRDHPRFTALINKYDDRRDQDYQSR